jgi:hypothetical protein
MLPNGRFDPEYKDPHPWQKSECELKKIYPAKIIVIDN